MTTIHTDCRRYRVSEPCVPHKQKGVCCPACEAYDPVDFHVLIVKLGAAGDVLRTTSILAPLKRQHPRSRVTWITRRNCSEVLSCSPDVDRIFTIESNYLEHLLCETFDLAIGPDADPLSASIMKLARATTKYGFTADEHGGVMPLNSAADCWWHLGLNDSLKRENRRTYGEWLYAICELTCPVERPCLQVSEQSREMVAAFVQEKIGTGRCLICFNTGAGERWREKRWKLEHYCGLAESLHGCCSEIAILLVGGPEEKEFNQNVLASSPYLIDAGTNNSIDQFAALIAACNTILTPDSLGYHVACAVGTRAVCLAGPTSPWELDVFGTNLVLHSQLDCIACYLSVCPFNKTCMDRLGPKAILPWVLGENHYTGYGIIAVPDAQEMPTQIKIQPAAPAPN